MGWVSGLAMCNPRRPEPNMCLLSLFYFLCLYTYAKGKPLSRVQNFRSRVQTPSARLQRYTSFCDPCSSSIVIFFSLNLRLLLFNLLFLFKVKTATPYFSSHSLFIAAMQGASHKPKSLQESLISGMLLVPENWNRVLLPPFLYHPFTLVWNIGSACSVHTLAKC